MSVIAAIAIIASRSAPLSSLVEPAEVLTPRAVRRRRGGDAAPLPERLELALAHARPIGGENFEKDRSEGEPAAAPTERQAAHLLRAHVADLALEHARLRLGRARRRLGDTEVDDL